jgi:hypothetical protein
MIRPNESARRAARRPRIAAGVLAAALLAAAAALAACERDQPTGPGRAAPERPSLTLNAACDPGLGGQTHVDSVTSPETWSRADNPHHVGGDIYIEGAGVLTLEPGVLVCFGGNGRLHANHGGRLAANGLDTARIVLTATDTDWPWYGLLLIGTPASASSLRNVLIEHTYSGVGLATYGEHAAIVDSAVFRQNGRPLYLYGRGTSLSRSRVDTSTMADFPAVEMGSNVTFEQNVIRGAAGTGLAVVGTHGVSLLGGRIEGSGGVGLFVTTTGAGFVATQPLRVVGGAGYPAELVVSAFPRIYSTIASQDSLLGNARDTLVVTGGILQQFAYPTQALPWRVTGNITVQYYGILRPGPGASLAFTAFTGITARYGGRVVARGTQAAPVLFTAAGSQGWNGIWLEGAPTLSSYLTNVRVEHMVLQWRPGIDVYSTHPLVIDSAVFRQNAYPLALSSGSSIRRSRVDTTLAVLPAVQLASGAIMESTVIRGSGGVGLRVHTADVQVVSCEIRGSADAGIELLEAADVHDCNLVDNGGPGILNLDTATANVENNWWGDAAGPTGTNGDGASGPLDYTPWRTTPFVLPYVP